MRTAASSGATARTDRSKTTARHASAFRAGEDALAGTRHGVGLFLYYKLLVALAGPRTSSLVTQLELAERAGVTVRTIRRYDDHLVDAGLIWLEKDGHSYRRYISAYESVSAAQTSLDDAPEPRAPEVQSVEPDPFFWCARCGQISTHEPDRSVVIHPLKGSLSDQREGYAPLTPQAAGDSFRSRRREFFHREEAKVGDLETMQLLEQIGCYPATVRRLGHFPPALVRGQIDAARRCGRAADLAAFVAFVLENGFVYGSSWSGRAQPPKDPPAVADPVESRPPGPPLPTVCPTCGAICPASWEGHCKRCDPEAFELKWGET